MRAERKVRHRATGWIILIACLLFAAFAAGQPDDSKPPPAAKDQAKPDAKPGRSRPAPPEGRESPRGGDRIRLDVPVSFPVDI